MLVRTRLPGNRSTEGKGRKVNQVIQDRIDARRAQVLALVEDIARYTLPMEDCPQRCFCGSIDGAHDPTNDDQCDSLTFFVQRARKAIEG